MNRTAKGSDFPTMSLFVNPLACMSLTSNVPTGFNSRSLKHNKMMNEGIFVTHLHAQKNELVLIR